jgi:oligosaccharide repeat unit polymerase
MLEDWVISLGLTFLLMIFAVVMRLQEGNWLAPGPFFAMVWSVYLMFPLFLTDYIIKPSGVLWILFAVMLVNIGSMMGSGSGFIKGKITGTPPGQETGNSRPPMTFPTLTKPILIFSLLGLGAVMVLILDSGRGWGAFFSLSSLGEIGREYSVLRYSDTTYREPELANFLTTFIFAGAFLGGMLFRTATGKLQRWVALLPIGVGILVAVVLTTRASFLFAGIIWVSTYLAAEVLITQGRSETLTACRVFIMVIAGLVIFIAYVALQLVRWGIKIDMITFKLVKNAIAQFFAAFLGSPATFTQWFAAHWQDAITSTYGDFTFPYIKKLFGDFSRTRFELVNVGYNLLDQSKTNVFTIFRDLIEDYTIFGAVPILFLLGMFSGLAYRRILQGKVRYLPALAACYCIFIDSLTGFIFHQTILCAALILFEVYIYFKVIGNVEKIRND